MQRFDTRNAFREWLESLEQHLLRRLMLEPGEDVRDPDRIASEDREALSRAVEEVLNWHPGWFSLSELSLVTTVHFGTSSWRPEPLECGPWLLHGSNG
jgi:hypothetical protein